MTHRLNFRHHAIAAAVWALAAPGAHALVYTWSSGDFVAGVTAPATLGAGDVLDITAGGFKFFNGPGSNFSNSGTVNWTADPLYLMSGTAVVNNGLWNASSDNNLLYNGGAGPSFTNNGVFRKSAGAGSTTIGALVGFVNNGTLDAQSGSIEFVGGSSFNAGSVFTGAGLVNLSSGSNTFNGSFTSSNLLLSGGTHVGNGAVVGGTVAFAGGALSGSWAIGAGQTLNGNSGGFKYIDGAGTVLTNQGTLAWNTADLLYFQNGASLRNQALFVANTSSSVVYNGGSQPVFDNTASGTVRAVAGVNLAFNNGAGFVNNGGTLEAATGATIRYNGGAVFNASSQFTGAGSNIASGSNSFNGSLQSGNLVLESGVHAGGAAVMNGLVRWTGGTVSSDWTVAAGQTLQAQAGSFKYLDGAGTVLRNQGTVAWNTGELLYLQNGASLRNQGLFVANTSTSIVYNGGSAPAFDNTASGTVRAAAGTTLNIGGLAGFVNNGGTLDAQAGAAITYNGAVFNAGTQFTGAGSNVAAGSNSFNGSFGSANLVLQSGSHNGTAAVIGGQAAFTGGSLTGTWRVAPGQTLTAGDGGFKYVEGSGTVLTNQGSMAWATSDQLYLMSGATLLNQGTLNFSGNGGVLYNGGSAPSFVNTGLITKTGGAGTTTISDNLGFDNLGTVDVQAGTIALPGNFTNHGRLQGSGTFSVSGSLTNAGMLAPGAAVGTLGLAGSYVQTVGGSFEVDLGSPSSHDLFNISGSALLGGQLSIHCFGACSLAVGDVVTILNADGELSGSFASVALSGFATGAFDVLYDTASDRVQLRVTQAVTAAVPEPGSVATLLAGLVLLGGLARRRLA